MFRTVRRQVLAFDAEWVPDAALGRALYALPAELDEAAVWQEMWRHAGATEEQPRPYLKTILCRVASIAGVLRSVDGGEVSLRLISLPDELPADGAPDEADMIYRFLAAVGRRTPQLVGFNSKWADLKIFVQRGVALGLEAPEFCRRPARPWDGPDYFARGSEWNVDLKEILGGWGRLAVSLHELATACGIPGKLDVHGGGVYALWAAGDYEGIRAYNELDAFTTYLVWLRVAHFAGHFDAPAYREEQDRFRVFLEAECQQRDAPHVADFLAEWDRLRSALGR